MAATFGPFHRLASPTQDDATALLQQESQEIWGRPRKDSDIPQVQAYNGGLPKDAKGIEFVTETAPDRGTIHPRWTGPRQGVTIEDGFAKISCRITRNTQINGVFEQSSMEEKEEEEELLVA